MIELLEEKKQVILYGPPGTGKTYVAKKIAEFLAPEKVRRKIVQFHPSYSYEDFVEGYRPSASDGESDSPTNSSQGRFDDSPWMRPMRASLTSS